MNQKFQENLCVELKIFNTSQFKNTGTFLSCFFWPNNYVNLKLIVYTNSEVEQDTIFSNAVNDDEDGTHDNDEIEVVGN